MGPDQWRDQGTVVGAVGQRFGGDDDEVPLARPGAGGVGVDGGGGYGGEDGMGAEGVVAKGVSLEVDAMLSEGPIV
jgi:hypothetical protein